MSEVFRENEEHSHAAATTTPETSKNNNMPLATIDVPMETIFKISGQDIIHKYDTHANAHTLTHAHTHTHTHTNPQAHPQEVNEHKVNEDRSISGYVLQPLTITTLIEKANVNNNTSSMDSSSCGGTNRVTLSQNAPHLDTNVAKTMTTTRATTTTTVTATSTTNSSPDDKYGLSTLHQQTRHHHQDMSMPLPPLRTTNCGSSNLQKSSQSLAATSATLPVTILDSTASTSHDDITIPRHPASFQNSFQGQRQDQYQGPFHLKSSSLPFSTQAASMNTSNNNSNINSQSTLKNSMSPLKFPASSESTSSGYRHRHQHQHQHQHHHRHTHHDQLSTTQTKKMDTDSKESSDNGSGSDSGYVGSASSNDDASCGHSSPSISTWSTSKPCSSSSLCSKTKKRSSSLHRHERHGGHVVSEKKQSCTSSELADFSSDQSSTLSAPRGLSFVGPLADSSDGSSMRSSMRGDSMNMRRRQDTIVSNSNSNGHGHGHRHICSSSNNGSSTSSKVLIDRPTTTSNALSSHSASLHSASLMWSRRRYLSRSKRSKISSTVGSKTTGLSDHDKESMKEDDEGSNNEPTFTLPNTWSFVERQFKKKKCYEEVFYDGNTYEENCKELNANFRSAVTRIHHLDSYGSTTSTKSSRTTDDAMTTGALWKESCIYDMGVDVMAKILSYLHPPQAYSFLSNPISKTFNSTFSNPQDLWKVLCLSEPFYAKPDKPGDTSDDSYPICQKLEVNHLLGRYRLLYSSFIKCVRYLDRIKEDSNNGVTPQGVYDEDVSSENSFEDNSSLRGFFAKVQKRKRKESFGSFDSCSVSGYSSSAGISSSSSDNMKVESTQLTKGKGRKPEPTQKKAKIMCSISKLTKNLLGPSHSSGIPGNVGLPWSCAMYSIVNWMVAFADVAGIQLMCLQVLPDLLVDEQQRTSAQHAGLTDIVLRAMVLFPDMVQLHTAAFHNLVLLARPLGGTEGRIFYTAMVNACGIFNIGSSTGKSGIAIMLDSMKRFVNDEDLQAMSCWSMVNIALNPSQKVALVRLGGISAANNAMIHHPNSAEVQFRALFALINLVVPSENHSANSVEAETIREQVADMNQESETEVLDEIVGQVTNLVVVAMKKFCSSESILNRACLVLHNLSLNESYHTVLLLTPNCYQLINWCIGNYRHDTVLQQSACGTRQRLQMTLSTNQNVREAFRESLRCQQQVAMESARRDAALMSTENNRINN